MRLKCTVESSVRIYIIVVGLTLVGLIGTLKAEADSSFVLTGSLSEPRSHFAAVLLPDGKVLVVPG